MFVLYFRLHVGCCQWAFHQPYGFSCCLALPKLSNQHHDSGRVELGDGRPQASCQTCAGNYRLCEEKKNHAYEIWRAWKCGAFGIRNEFDKSIASTSKRLVGIGRYRNFLMGETTIHLALKFIGTFGIVIHVSIISRIFLNILLTFSCKCASFSPRLLFLGYKVSF